jgi:predicted DNA-binding transcriptional regulator YafY
MEIFLLLAATALMLYFYLKDDSSKNNSSRPEKTYKNTSSYTGSSSNYGAKKYDVSLIQTNKLIIEDAINRGIKISFRYKDKSDQITTRTVTPQKIFLYEFDEREGKMLCLEAFCHLRNSNRTFALFRMTQTAAII